MTRSVKADYRTPLTIRFISCVSLHQCDQSIQNSAPTRLRYNATDLKSTKEADKLKTQSPARNELGLDYGEPWRRSHETRRLQFGILPAHGSKDELARLLVSARVSAGPRLSSRARVQRAAEARPFDDGSKHSQRRSGCDVERLARSLVENQAGVYLEIS